MPKEIDPRFAQPHPAYEKMMVRINDILTENDADITIYDRTTIESFRLKK